MKSNKATLDRMKAMMTYGLQTESKKQEFSGLEYSREAADGKMYGIVREGTKYYIKVSNKKNNVVKENFDYIGGFRNRKDYEYNSYANALKNFEMKMASINESRGNREPLIESWNPDKKEQLTVEATNRMKQEIARQREIMGNARMIQEGKGCKVNSECAATQKPNMKAGKAATGKAVNTNGDPYTEKAASEFKKVQAPNIKGEGCARVNEGEQVLGWNDNEDYLDTANGTEVGDSAPYNNCKGGKCEMKNGTVEEGAAMHNSDNQNTPTVGVGEIGDDAPFTEKAKNELQEERNDYFYNPDVPEDEQLPAPPDEVILDDEDYEMEEPIDDEFGGEDEFDGEEAADEFDVEPMGDEFDAEESEDFDDANDTVTKADFDALKELVQAIADKVGAEAFSDDDLYDEEATEDEDEIQEEAVVYESRSYRQMMQEDRLDYFGKHPAYRKKPMELPTAKHQEMADYYDMNDESAYSEAPFGEKIGSSAPFEVEVEAIENAIAESIKRVLKKKI